MSLRRSDLKEILSEAGVTAEKIDAAVSAIIDRHTATVDKLKDDIAELKTESAKVTELTEKLTKSEADLKAAQDALKTAEPYKEKYDKEHADFEAFKADAAGKESKAKADTALTKLLTDQGYSAAGIAKIIKYGGFTPEFDDKGNITNTDAIMQSVSSEWGEYHNSPVKTEGVQTAQPPATKAGGMTKDDIMKIKDPTERINAIKANPEAFGLTNKE